jgi:hypothetical protein
MVVVTRRSTRDNIICYRISIQFKPKGGFILTSSPRGEHPLLQFIQAALNIHNDSAQLLEALERTTIPLAVLSSVVSSQLISAKCYRQDVSTMVVDFYRYIYIYCIPDSVIRMMMSFIVLIIDHTHNVSYPHICCIYNLHVYRHIQI